jgi:CBS domain-containing protein
MTTVKQVLDKKGNDVHFIHPGASVFDALKLMAENDIGSLLVLEDDKLVGIITERHYAREIVLKGKTSPGTLVRDIMSTKVICARSDQSVEEPVAELHALVGLGRPCRRGIGRRNHLRRLTIGIGLGRLVES